jgi:RNA polymerase sigma factor (sigma-70 family)
LEFAIDHSLIQRCLKDDPKAQSELYKLVYKTLIGVCWRYSSDKEQAVEYFNLGFVRILLNLKKYNPEVPFEMWARRVMINNIINEFKRNKNWKEKFSLGKDEKMISLQADKDLSDHQEEMLDLIKSKSLKLPPMTLKVFNLYAIDGYMHNEIAELLGISEGTSAWHYSEAKKRIRQMIGLESRIVDNGK